MMFRLKYKKGKYYLQQKGLLFWSNVIQYCGYCWHPVTYAECQLKKAQLELEELNALVSFKKEK
jgi:hypothetical protein